jgi:chromosome partitioning protein
MSTQVLTFFNNKGGVGKTSLVFHLAWMLSEMGYNVVAIDLDPQANLTSAFLDEATLETLWGESINTAQSTGNTIFECIQPLLKTGDILPPVTHRVNAKLHLIAGDLRLASYEDTLSTEWSNAMGSSNLYRPFRLLTAFWLVAQMAASEHQANIILADVGPTLGAINRSALIGTDFVVIPLAADLFSLQGLRNLGPTLRRWRTEWSRRTSNWHENQANDFALPVGAMRPVGFVLMQHLERLTNPIKSYRKWADRIPEVYQNVVLEPSNNQSSLYTDIDYCLAKLKHFRSLVPMGQEVRKPIFNLTNADGAIGSHAAAVQAAKQDFKALANAILKQIKLAKP